MAIMNNEYYSAMRIQDLNKPLILHLTYEFYDLIAKGEKTHEYRPMNDYYMRRIEKLRDWIAFVKNVVNHGVEPESYHIFLEFRRAYNPKSSQSVLFFPIRSIKLFRLKDLPNYVRRVYPEYHLENWFYDIDFTPKEVKKVDDCGTLSLFDDFKDFNKPSPAVLRYRERLEKAHEKRAKNET